jgi:hypothetical protein
MPGARERSDGHKQIGVNLRSCGVRNSNLPNTRAGYARVFPLLLEEFQVRGVLPSVRMLIFL